MSDKNAEANRVSQKAAAKLFQSKLEQARTAASVSLQNKSVEMTAVFQEKLVKELKEMKDGGGTLLAEMQEKYETAAANSSRSARSTREQRNLKLTQKLLKDAEKRMSAVEQEKEELHILKQQVESELNDARTT